METTRPKRSPDYFAWPIIRLLLLASFLPSFLQLTSAKANTWVLLGLADQEISSLAIDPENPSIICVATSQGVFKSTDAGITWTVSTGEIGARPVLALVIDPIEPSIQYALAHPSPSTIALYRSTDRGTSWSKVNVELTVSERSDAAQKERLFRVFAEHWRGPTSLAIHPKDLSRKLYLVGPALWVSESRGAHWLRLADTQSNMTTLAFDPKEPSTLYVGTQTQDIQKSTDGGKHWRTLGMLYEPSTVVSIAVDPNDSAVIYAATPDGVHKSTDAADTWVEINNGLPVGGAWTRLGGALVIDHMNPSMIYTSGYGRVYLSSNRGESWTVLGTGLPEDTWVKLLVLDSTGSSLYASATQGLWVLHRP